MKITLLFLSALAAVSGAPSRRERDIYARALQNTGRDFGIAPALERRNNTGGEKIKSTIEFSNKKAKDFYVDGSSIPEVAFDAGPSWSGLMPISSDPNETRKLFFWFWPSRNASLTDDLVFWTNGGPGCSSMEGFLQENGPISWAWGAAHPTYNPYSWNNISHMLYVEQPVGTGFSQGEPSITNDDELAEQLVGFFNQFLDVFSELKGKNLLLSGESYSGFYVPYIANYIYENTTSETFPLNLKGIWIADPSTSYDVVQEQIPAVTYMHQHENLFGLNETYMAYLDAQDEKCGYAGYIDKYLTYPPTGPLPLPNGTSDVTAECDLFSAVFEAALRVNPAFNLYRISDSWNGATGVLWDVLGFPGSLPNQQSPVYFNRTDVQDAIHAPHINWEECAAVNVYNTSDGYGTNAPSGLSVLPNVIEKSQRTVILHGTFDYVLIHQGTQLMIQNMTWGSQQGFQTAPTPESLIMPGLGAVGMVHTERNLTYVQVNGAGHMIPQFAPQVAYTTLQYLLGQIDEFPTSSDGETLQVVQAVNGPIVNRECKDAGSK